MLKGCFAQGCSEARANSAKGLKCGRADDWWGLERVQKGKEENSCLVLVFSFALRMVAHSEKGWGEGTPREYKDWKINWISQVKRRQGEDH